MRGIKLLTFLPLLLFTTLLIGCKSRFVSQSDDANSLDTAAHLIAIKGVNVIPMTPENKVLHDVNLVISGNKIVSVDGAIPAGAKVIDCKGKWLIPGLIDMHVHNLADIEFGKRYPTKGASFMLNTQDFMTLYVANGVTTVFDLNARVEHIAERNEIAAGKVIGPRMALAALINGGEGYGNIANTPGEGRQAVRLANAAGYDFIKAYSQLNIETFNAVVDEAQKQGMKVVGHIPNAFGGMTEQAFVPNFDLVAHAEEFAKQSEDFSNADIGKFVTMAKANGTWLCPTLITIKRIADQARSLDSVGKLRGFRYVHPLMQSKWLTANNYNRGTSPERVARLEKLLDFNNRLVSAFHDAGIPIVTGTDAATSGVIWGFALHDELEMLVEAGMSPEDVLISATCLPAKWLGIGDKVGTIEPGKFADFVLLDANPLTDIKNTQKISGVCFNGRWVVKEEIGQMLSHVAQWNTANIDRFDWKRRKER